MRYKVEKLQYNNIFSQNVVYNEKMIIKGIKEQKNKSEHNIKTKKYI